MKCLKILALLGVLKIVIKLSILDSIFTIHTFLCLLSAWHHWWLLAPPPSKTFVCPSFVCPVISSVLCVISLSSVFLVGSLGVVVVFLDLIFALASLQSSRNDFVPLLVCWRFLVISLTGFWIGFLNNINLLYRKSSVITNWSLETSSSQQLTGLLAYQN